ncbi:MAG: hypothetical protein FJ104_08570 [Deltaproteobacteria bacterium]|nr:hypothetical protein [Deltaproteobacteria bacterium]
MQVQSSGLLAFTLALAASFTFACGSHDVRDAPRGGPDGADSGEPGGDGGAVDGQSNIALGDAGLVSGLAGCGFPACPRDAIRASRSGNTPWGTFEISNAAVGYTLGFTWATHVELSGTIGGEPAELAITLTTQSANPMWLAPPGTYRGGADAGSYWISANLVRAARGASDPCERLAVPALELVIERHTERSAGVRAGDEAELVGIVKIHGSGFDLDAAFDIDRICDRYNTQ